MVILWLDVLPLCFPLPSPWPLTTQDVGTSRTTEVIPRRWGQQGASKFKVPTTGPTAPTERNPSSLWAQSYLAACQVSLSVPRAANGHVHRPWPSLCALLRFLVVRRAEKHNEKRSDTTNPLFTQVKRLIKTSSVASESVSQCQTMKVRY